MTLPLIYKNRNLPLDVVTTIINMSAYINTTIGKNNISYMSPHIPGHPHTVITICRKDAKSMSQDLIDEFNNTIPNTPKSHQEKKAQDDFHKKYKTILEATAMNNTKIPINLLSLLIILSKDSYIMVDSDTKILFKQKVKKEMGNSILITSPRGLPIDPLFPATLRNILGMDKEATGSAQLIDSFYDLYRKKVEVSLLKPADS